MRIGRFLGGWVLSLAVLSVHAAGPPPTPTPWPALKSWKASEVPWDGWFKGNVLVTEKKGYVHFFLNAQDLRKNLETKDKRQRLAETALEMARRLYPPGAKADRLKLDIVYVLERDEYGAPKWDSLKRVAHFEVDRSKIPAVDGAGKPADLKAEGIFDKVLIHP